MYYTIKQKSFYFLLLLFVSCKAPLFKVTESGLFSTGIDIVYTPTFEGDSIVLVDADNVMLDFSGSVFAQDPSDLVSHLNGVEVAAGRSSVIIRNITVDGLTGHGILINQGCRDIIIEDYKSLAIGKRSIDFDGKPANPILGVTVARADIFKSCTNAATGDKAIRLNFCNNIELKDCNIDGCGNSSVDFSGVFLNACSLSKLSNIRINNNTGLSVTCFDIIDSANGIYTSCVAKNNSPVAGGAFYGVNVRMKNGMSSNNTYCSCIVEGNASTANLVGYLLKANQSVLRHCFCNYNVGDAVTSIQMIGGMNNSIYDCAISCNNAESVCIGIDCIGEHMFVIQDNHIRCNKGNIVYGIKLTNNDNTLGLINNNELLNNVGTTTSFGLVDESSASSNVVIGNIAFNQMTNFSVTYGGGVILPVLVGSLSSVPGLPAGVGSMFDNISVKP